MRVVILCRDLMDRSKMSAAWPDAQFVPTIERLRSEAIGADLIVVDLSLVAEPRDLEVLQGRTIAFGSHVDDEQLLAAFAAGAEALPRSVFFRRLSDPSTL